MQQVQRRISCPDQPVPGQTVMKLKQGPQGKCGQMANTMNIGDRWAMEPDRDAPVRAVLQNLAILSTDMEGVALCQQGTLVLCQTTGLSSLVS
ncbi:hypothetical protein AAES_73456 [Amazona aestiva]|uniref:Uncharacterized protein n=1 Tax=Amazona aestiva TaxID=12930 RepID=A0A0Q3R9S5_AMAAE|nr:hypothetical protein AAES_73456 [Amazona aestiva]